MSRSLGVLTLDLVARLGGFEQGMDRAGRRVRQTANEMEAARRTADRLVAGIAAAAAGFATAATAMAVSAAKSMDATSKMAQQIGTTTEALSGMRFAAQQFANISDQQFDMSMRRMTRRIAEAAEGSGAAKGALDAMGLSARELARLSPDKQMLAIADAMQRTERQADRLRHTMAIFDTEGMALVPALQQGAEALEQNISLARQFGVVVSTEAAQAADRFLSNMNLLNEAQKGFKNQIAESVLPVLADFSGRLVEAARGVEDMGKRADTALKAVGVVVAATAVILTSRLLGSITRTAAEWVLATRAAAAHQAQLAATASAAAGASRTMMASSAAMAASMTTFTRVGRVALGVMGGPAGIIATSALAGAALLAMGRDAKTASVDVDELTESLNTLSQRKLRSAAFNLENELVELSKQAEEHGQILRTLNADYDGLTKRYGENYEGLRNVRQAIRDEEEAFESVIATIAKKSPLLAQITQRLWDLDTASRGAAGGVDTLNRAMGFSEAGEKYLAQIQGRIKALQDAGDPIKIASRYIAEHTELTEADRVAIMSAAHAEKALIAARDAAAKATKAGTNAINEAKRAAEAFRREQDQSLRAQLQSVSAIHAQAQALEDQVALFGQSATAIEDLTIARLEEQAAMLRGFDGSQEAVEAIEREIEARQRLRIAIGSLEQKEAERQAWEAWARDVETIFDQVGQSLTDAIFEGGKSGRDLLKDLFKTLTFRVLIQPVMGQMQGWVTNQLGGLFGVQNPQQGGGMLGTAQNLYSGYNAITGGLNSTLGNAAQWLGQKIGSEALTSFGLGLSGATAATGIASIGAGLGASLGTTIGTSAAAMTTTTFSAALGGGAAAGGAAAGGAAGAAGIGSAVGAALPWIGGALAIGSAFGLFDDRLPTTRRSQQGASHMLPDGSWEVSSWDDRQDTASQIAARDFAQAAVKHANDLFERIGIDAQIHSFQTLMESSILGDKQGVGSSGQVRIGDVIRDIGLTVESSWTKHGVGGWSDAPMLPRLQTDIQLTILEAFQAVGDELPDVLSSMLEGVDIRSLGAEQAQALAQSFQLVVDQVSAFQTAVEALPFEQLRDLSFDAAANLIQFAGGLEQLDAGMTAYFQNFYSEAERLDWLSKQVSGSLSELGLVMPDVTQGADEAKSAWRAIVESLDVTTEEGQRAYATMMTLSGSFAQLVTGMDQLSDATQRAHQELLNSLMGDVNAALSAVQQRGQERIAKLSESFARTDAVFNAYRSKVQQLESQWGSLISTMDRSMRDLRGQVEASARLQYDQARAVISTALLTGQMPQTADLGEAIRIAQQGVMGGVYATTIDQERAYIRLSNELEALKGIAEPELDAAQASLEKLEQQYNKLRGIEDYSGKSLSQLEKQLGVALSAEAAARTQIEQIERQIAMAQAQYHELVGINDELSTLPGALQALAKAVNAAAAAQKAQQQSGAQRSRELQYLADNPDVMAQYGQHGKGMTLEEYARLHYDLHGRKEGRAFARGGLALPGWALVGEEGPELVNFSQPGRVYTANQTQDLLRNMGAGRQTEREMVAELRALRQQNARLESRLASIEQYTGQLADQFDNVSAGGNALATEVMA